MSLVDSLDYFKQHAPSDWNIRMAKIWTTESTPTKITLLST